MSETHQENPFAANRARLLEAMPPRSAALIFSAERHIRSGDTEYPYCQDKNFYYLTGIESPEARLLLIKEASRSLEQLYLHQRSAEQAHWFGASMPPEVAKEISGLKSVLPLDRLESALGRLLPRLDSLLVDYETVAPRGALPPRLQLVEELRRRFPALIIQAAGPFIHRMRELKAGWEVERITRAAEITGEAIRRVLAHARPGVTENELQAHFEFELRCQGCPPAFPAIFAGGANATVLHYIDNDQPVPAGSLVLLDVGAEYRGYSADVSRTFPVDGRFTDRQRTLYELVLAANQAVIAEVAPEVTFARLSEVARQTMAPGLKELGLIESEDQVSRYLTHGVSHPLGLDTHDVRVTLPETCRPGVVLTVEPGLYLPEEQLGIRIEDDVLVTEDGHRVLSGSIPKSAEEMERLVGTALTT